MPARGPRVEFNRLCGFHRANCKGRFEWWEKEVGVAAIQAAHDYFQCKVGPSVTRGPSQAHVAVVASLVEASSRVGLANFLHSTFY